MNQPVENATKIPPFMKWAPLILFCVIQIGASADSSVLVNATSALITSLHATVSGVQIANAIYPLVASALMIICGFLGLIIGWKRMLQIGLLILATGEALAAFSPNMIFFTYVARVLTGIGASICIPGVLGLIPGTYHGRDQAIAFAGIAASNGLASAIGPIAGGAVIVLFGWQWAFLMLAILFAICLVCSAIVRPIPKLAEPPKFDVLGASLIIISMVLIISGLLTISEWGFISPIKPPFTLFGMSPSLYLVGLGIFSFWCFLHWQEKIEAKGRMAFLPAIFLTTRQARSGLYLTALIFLAIGSFSFLIITFLQVVVGFNAMQSGLVLADYAIGMVIFSLGIPLLFKHASPRLVCRLGIIILVLSCFGIAYGLETSATNKLLLIGLFCAGAGCGMVASQASIVITSAVPDHYAEQSGGVQGTMRNLGQAVGVAVSGVILITCLSASLRNAAQVSPYIPQNMKQKAHLITNVPFVSNAQVESALNKVELPKAERQALIVMNEHSRLYAARVATISVGFMIFLFLFCTKFLPTANGSSMRSKKDQGEKASAAKAGA